MYILVFLNTFLLFVFGYFHIGEFYSYMFSTDTFFITRIIYLLGLFGVLYSSCIFLLKEESNLKYNKTCDFFSEMSILLGLVGTIVGIIYSLTEINPEKVSDIKYVANIVGQLLHGLSIALNTTLAGSIFFGWIQLNKFINSRFRENV